MNRITFLLLLSLAAHKTVAQQAIEFAIKPTEMVLLNFEANLGIGNQKVRYGVFGSVRPSTQESGVVDGMG